MDNSVTSALIPLRMDVFISLDRIQRGRITSSLTVHLALVHVWAQMRLTLCDPMDCSPPGSSVHGTFQARTLVWVVIAYHALSIIGFLLGPTLIIESLTYSLNYTLHRSHQDSVHWPLAFRDPQNSPGL